MSDSTNADDRHGTIRTSSDIVYRTGPSALPADAFIALATRVWPRDYDAVRVAEALTRSLNVGAWCGDRLVGSVRVLSDGYLFNTIPEIMVDPEFQRQGIGRTLMRKALGLARGGRVLFRPLPGNEPFFEGIGFRRGPIGFVGRVEDMS